MRQHLTAFQAAVEIGKAVVAGDAIGSSKVMFHLHELSVSEYKCNWSEESGTFEEITNAREP